MKSFHSLPLVYIGPVLWTQVLITRHVKSLSRVDCDCSIFTKLERLRILVLTCDRDDLPVSLQQI